FGYFPCYTVGALLAAQLFRAVRAALPDLPRALAAGEFGDLLGWLREKIHGQGSRPEFAELVREASGAPLSCDAFFAHLAERYGTAPESTAA
ncbi:MAG TPA: carboxypeptidase M32, partial [Rhodospirillales bacterium]|nr:carboxypeptidase M32 [Rhodospirillales bacterium]